MERKRRSSRKNTKTFFRKHLVKEVGANPQSVWKRGGQAELPCSCTYIQEPAQHKRLQGKAYTRVEEEGQQRRRSYTRARWNMEAEENVMEDSFM
ncbi:unnamed protein product [Allacma fusca]|uniref:Uncharacterized protein n=1 Tax=Allacma fusca TaxID=39272 RepID=A0A8J2KPW3_9HEXA|nr:unnamed protein product [Allacma fusca]